MVRAGTLLCSATHGRTCSQGGFNSMAESRNVNTSATAFMTIQPIKGLRFRSQFNYNWGSGAYRNYGEPRIFWLW